MVLSQSSYKKLLVFLVIGLLLQFSTDATAQENTFECNGDLIITLSGSGVGGGTKAFNIELIGSAAQFGSLADFTISINSSGFNSQDGYIYGITGGNDIIRLKSNGTFDNLGEPTYLPNGLSAAGDFDANGIYWIHHRGDASFYGIDVNNGNMLVDHLELQWHPSTGNSGKFAEDIDDLVFDPLDKTSMYTYQRNSSGPTGTRGHLLRANIDPSSPEYGFIFSEGKLTSSEIIHIGAMFFDSQGQLFGYGANSQPINQNRLIRIDRDPTRANLVAIGPGASANDGCSCPFSMYVTKATDDAYNVCLSETMRFDYVIGNTSNVRPDGVTFRDTFPPGFEIMSIDFSEIFGNVAPGTGIGTNKLTITDIDFANKEVMMSVYVKPSLVSGTYNIQARLEDLPKRFGSKILADDPETLASNDPTIFIVDYELFTEAFDIGDDVVMCEGEIANFTANIPLSGTLITWNTGETGPFASTANTGMVIATAELGACYDIDTALVEVVPYPVIDLMADITLCANETTILEVPYQQGHTYLWSTGENNNAIIATKTGEYTLEVNDRGCITKDTVDVDFIFEGYDLVLPDLKFCEGEGFDINISNPWPVTYEWSLPGGGVSNSNVLTYSDMVASQSGQFTIDMEYLDCKITETFMLDVLEYPLSALAPVERPCIGDAVDLSVPFDSDYTYDWNTGETTSDISVSETDMYIVVIDNDGCITTDSARVEYVFEQFQDGFPDVTLCEGDSLSFVANNDFPVDYLWTLPDGTEITESKIEYDLVDESDAGNISLYMQYNQCIFDDEFLLNVNPQPELEIDNEVTFDLCDSITIDIDNVTPGTTIEWTPADIVSCQDCEHITVMTTRSGYITVRVVDDIGCETIDSVYLDLGDIGLGSPTHIPNIFSPNDDRSNDFFVVLPLCYKILKFEIFDRWGNNVYSKTQHPETDSVEWDGQNHVGPCEQGVYTWVAEFHYINSGELRILSGDVTIVR